VCASDRVNLVCNAVLVASKEEACNGLDDDCDGQLPSSETDSDGDGTSDCGDGCPTDAAKLAAGSCGCGVADTNTDGDAQADVATDGLADVVEIAAGDYHTCARKGDGSVLCWGYNYYGQIARGGTAPSYIPIEVPGLTGVIRLALGEVHSCALRDDGTVMCWGWNIYGQLGNQSTSESATPTPVTVFGLTDAVDVTAGNRFTCASKSDGSVACWGYNLYAQLGDGTTTNASIPVPVIGLSNIISFSGGGSHACAIVEGGLVKCWGSNSTGQLGDGTLLDADTPLSVSGVATFTNVHAGTSHTCARRTDRAVMCWNFGHLGAACEASKGRWMGRLVLSNVRCGEFSSMGWSGFRGSGSQGSGTLRWGSHCTRTGRSGAHSLSGPQWTTRPPSGVHAPMMPPGVSTPKRTHQDCIPDLLRSRCPAALPTPC